MKRLMYLLMLTFALVQCTNSKEEAKDAKIKTLEAVVNNSKNVYSVDSATINQLIKEYVAYSKSNPDSSISANYLFKAAGLTRLYNKDAARAIVLYQQVYVDFPAFEKRPHALFLQAFVFENEMNHIEFARKKYQEFIDTYPDHDLADDAQFSLNNLGKSPEEIIKELQEKSRAEGV